MRKKVAALLFVWAFMLVGCGDSSTSADALNMPQSINIVQAEG